MKNLFLIILFLTFFTSCISTKQMTYFQGEPVSKSELYKLNNEPYRLQINDILYIDIKGNNPEIVAMFTGNGGNTSSAANKTQNLYFTGYSVDRHGNIRIPYLGDMNVLGYTEKEIREKILGRQFYFKFCLIVVVLFFLFLFFVFEDESPQRTGNRARGTSTREVEPGRFAGCTAHPCMLIPPAKLIGWFS